MKTQRQVKTEPAAPVQDAASANPHIVRLQEARHAWGQHVENEDVVRADIRSAKDAMARAVKTEDFVAAQTAKEQREQLERRLGELVNLRGALQEAVQAATDAATEHFFSEKVGASLTNEVSVTRVVALNPATGEFAEATYLEGSTTIQLRLDEEQFESEAWHVGEWAAAHGFLVKHFVAAVTV
jgi:uncharacterized protein YcbX